MALEEKLTPESELTAEERKRQNEIKRQALLAEAAALEDKPKTPAEMDRGELFTAFGDAVMAHLGSHPKLEALWNEIKTRASKDMAPEPAASSSSEEKPAA